MKKLFTHLLSFTFSLLSLLLLSRSGQAQTFAKGADVGWLQQMEATGYVFYNDNGVAQDCFQILKDKGINAIRLRVFVNPSADKVSGHCSKDEVVAMSVRAKAMGFRIMIDFHYSDTWADPGSQVKPAAWANHTFAQLKTDVYDHTYDVMNALKTSGVTPEWVQVGNEIRGGMLRPDGSTSNYPQLAQLITSGYNGVKAVSPTSKVIVHLDQGNNSALYRGFFDALTTNGALYDVIGLSYYPYWLHQDYTASISSLANNLNDMVSRYGKEVVIAEVGGDYTLPQNTYDMLVTVQNVVKAVPNSKGLGVFYWEPEGAKSWSGYQLSAWGDDGKPTKAMNAFLPGATVTTPPSSPSLVVNPGFEVDAKKIQTPTGWTSYANTTGNYAADYAEAGGHSGGWRLTHYLATAYTVSTYQTLSGLPNGTYTLKAWVKNGGGQTTCQLYAKNFGGVEKNYPLPAVGDTWTQIQLTDIQVTNGQCEIGLYTVGKAGNYCSLDDVEFYANQSISFPALPAKSVNDGDFDPGASTSSGLPVTYSSSEENVATIINGKVHIVGVGTSTIYASQGGNTVYIGAAQVSQTLSVTKQDQTISLPVIPQKKADDPDFDPGAAASSSLPISLSSSNTAVATVLDNKIHLVGAGTTVITASQEGNGSYNAATPVSQTVIVSSINQLITFNTLPEKQVGDADFDATATASSGLGITYTSSNADVATIVDGKIHIMGPGSTTITASQLGNALYAAATSLTQTLTVVKLNQSIRFDPLPVKQLGDVDVDLTATASSGLVVSYVSSNTGVATIVDNKIHLVGAGTTIITAMQTGNDTYNAATEVSQSLLINTQPQTISFTALSGKKVGDADFIAGATASSGLVVSYSSSNTDVATIIDGKIHIVGAGSTTITASQEGNATYTGAASVPQTLTVSKQEQTITFNPLGEKKIGEADVDPQATSSAGLVVSYASSNAVVATIVAGKIHIVGAGTTTITASQAGNATYNAATSVTQQLTVILPAGVKINYQEGDNGQVANNNIKPNLTLVNEGTTSVPYSELTLRYWLTAENFTGINTWIDYAQLGNNKVKMKYVWTTQPRQGATGYIEYSFDASAGNLVAGGNSGPIQSRFANTDWSNLNEIDDYSYKTQTSYALNDHITVYRNGELIWGTEPAILTSLTKLKVYSQNTNSKTGGNSLSTYLNIANEGNMPVAYGDLSVRYWFTAEGTQNLNYWIDYAKLGSSNITGQFVRNVGRVKADSYFELKIKPGAGTLYPGSSTGNIQYRIAKVDWSAFNETNDYSYKPAAPLAESALITVYYKGELVYGTEPSSGARLAAEEVGGKLQVRLLGNPVQGDAAEIEIQGAENQLVQLQLINTRGTSEVDRLISRASAVERYAFPMGKTPGLYLLRVSIPAASVVVKVVKE